MGKLKLGRCEWKERQLTFYECFNKKLHHLSYIRKYVTIKVIKVHLNILVITPPPHPPPIIRVGTLKQIQPEIPSKTKSCPSLTRRRFDSYNPVYLWTASFGWLTWQKSHVMWQAAWLIQRISSPNCWPAIIRHQEPYISIDISKDSSTQNLRGTLSISWREKLRQMFFCFLYQ